MHHRIGQPHITVMPALEEVAFHRDPPKAAAGACLLEPYEIPAGLRLVHAIDPHGIVSCGAAKVLTPGALRVVRESPGVDEKYHSPDRQGERERVGMTMGGDRLIA